MRKELVAIACTSSDGSPTLVCFESEVTEEQYDLGMHYDDAVAQAKEDGYEQPFVCFDNFEHNILLHGVEQLKKHIAKQ